MVALNEASILQRLRNVKEGLSDIDSNISGKLNEKGVECALIMPLLETILDFDPIEDICYESSSLEKNGQRFDFLIENCFLIEAKRLNVSLKDMQEQLKRYILGNKNINFGILTNGIRYIVYLQKTFIREHSPENRELLVPMKKDVLEVLNFSVDDENFIDIIRLFQKDNYKYHFQRIAHYVLSCYNQGKVSKVCEDKELNELIKDKIRDSLNIQTGIYLNKINSGEYTSGDILVYTNENFEIHVTVQEDGRVKLIPGAVKNINFNGILNTKFENIIDLVRSEWTEEKVFIDPLDIIRVATKSTRLHNQSQYKFVKI